MFSLHAHLVSYTWSTMESRLFWLMLKHHGRNHVSREEKCAAAAELCVCKLSGAADWSNWGANSVLALGYVPLRICSPATSENAVFTRMLANVSFFPPHGEREEGLRSEHVVLSSSVLCHQPSIKMLLCHNPLTKWMLRGCCWAFTCLD